MKSVLRYDDYQHLRGRTLYEFDLDEDAGEVLVEVDFRVDGMSGAVLSAVTPEASGGKLMTLCAGKFFKGKFDLAGFDKLALQLGDTSDAVHVRIVAKTRKRTDVLDPIGVELIPPQRDTVDLQRMIATAVSGAMEKRFPNRFDDTDNDLSFDEDISDTPNTRYLERDDDFVSNYEEPRPPRRKKDAPPPKPTPAPAPKPDDPAPAPVPAPKP